MYRRTGRCLAFVCMGKMRLKHIRMGRGLVLLNFGIMWCLSATRLRVSIALTCVLSMGTRTFLLLLLVLLN